MGLDISHNAFHGAYTAFNRFRNAICKVLGGTYPPHPKDAVDDGGNPLDPSRWYWDGDKYSQSTHPGLYLLLCHSDCDGEIKPNDCKLIARELKRFVRPGFEDPSLVGMADGHLAYQGGYLAVLDKFIKGCEDAATVNEPLIFH